MLEFITKSQDNFYFDENMRNFWFFMLYFRHQHYFNNMIQLEYWKDKEVF